jgi:hypothetical protein
LEAEVTGRLRAEGRRLEAVEKKRLLVSWTIINFYLNILSF